MKEKLNLQRLDVDNFEVTTFLHFLIYKSQIFLPWTKNNNILNETLELFLGKNPELVQLWEQNMRNI